MQALSGTYALFGLDLLRQMHGVLNVFIKLDESATVFIKF
jgi:hypothetical protein